MAKPALLAVDDDADVLRAIERDLRRHYGNRYRILTAPSGHAALELLAKVRQRNEAIALFLVDHRMPQMNGIEFLSAAIQDFPDAARVLLTAYADTEAAIRAINEIRLNHYLLKPWDPPEENLYPVLDDLLEEWQNRYRPAFEGIRVVGTRWSARSHELRDFLARNQIPYRWLDVDAAASDAEVRRVLESLGPADERKLPVIILEDGTRLCEPSLAEVAQRVGLRTRADTDYYDVVIVGGGPAGLAAGVYGASEGLKSVIVEREAPGGQAGLSSLIENYLGFPAGVSGSDLARRAVAQARRFGVDILAPQEAVRVRAEGNYNVITLADESELSCQALLIATGVQWRKLDIPGMDRLNGAGVYYGGAATEALSCRGETVFIVGGANSAGQAAMNFSRYAREVVMLVRGESLSITMSKYLVDDIAKTPNIRVECGCQVVEAHGTDRLEAISIARGGAGAIEKVPAGALFVFIGAEPRTDWLDGFIERDARGFILTGDALLANGRTPKTWTSERQPGLLETSRPGVFAVGDVRSGSVKRVAAGVGEGSIAIQFVHRYLAKA
ncbi:MAG: FAD-dependent oxidoreductase [Bryobacteraceae bacterium]